MTLRGTAAFAARSLRDHLSQPRAALHCSGDISDISILLHSFLAGQMAGSLGRDQGPGVGARSRSGLAMLTRVPIFRHMLRVFDFCLPTGAKTVPAGPDWLHEVKYDYCDCA